MFVTFFIPLMIDFNISAQSFHTVNNKTLTTNICELGVHHIILATILLLFLFFTGCSYFLFDNKKLKRPYIYSLLVLLLINFLLTFSCDCMICIILVITNYFIGFLNVLIYVNADKLFKKKKEEILKENEEDNLGLLIK